MSLLTKFNLALIAVFALALVPAGWISHDLLQRSARTQVIENARIMMETALAVRTYTIKQIQPLLAPQLATTFLPQSVPAYSATEIFSALRQTNPEYAYKEATLNPTNPRNRTVDWEADLVQAFRNDAAKKVKGIDMGKLKQDLQSEAVTAEIRRVRDLAQKMGIQGTPHFLVGDRAIAGAPTDLLLQMKGHAADIRKAGGCKVC